MRARLRNGAMLVAIAAIALWVAGCGDDDEGADGAGGGENGQVAVLLSVGLDDTGFGRGMQAGIDQIESELGASVEAQDLIPPADFNSVLQDYASRGFSPVIATGVEFQDAVLRVAKEFPDTQFAVINGFAAQPPNVAAFDFAFEQPGFLAGLAAGLSTEEEKLGNIGGEQIPPIERLFDGFRQGVEAVNPDADIVVSYVGSFTDAAKAGQVADAQLSEGVDTIWAIADTANSGVFETVKDAGARVIGYGVDESALAPNNTLTTALVDYGSVLFKAAELALDGKLEPNVYVESFDQDVFGLAPVENVDAKTASEIEKRAERAEQGGYQIKELDLG